MFYEPGKTEHNLPYDPFKACVIPRPIGWISTVSPPQPSTSTSDSTSSNGHLEPETSPSGSTSGTTTRTANLAPFSQFNNLTFDPPFVMFSANQTPSGAQKDTVRNVEATGVFCWQLATWDLREAVNISAEQVAYGVDEFERAGLDKEWSTVLTTPVPMVKASPVKFECEYHSTLRLPGNPPMGTVDVVIGKVVGIHIDDRVLTEDGKIDVAKTLPIARCGYYDYAVVRETFEMIIPGTTEAIRYGMEGNVRKHKAAREAANKMGVSESGPP
ncbi:Flavin reductase like domain-containing protein [Cladophialophora immunda]|nr:Flavin reductase like domain-containing protein [Cladophialophora immunda]